MRVSADTTMVLDSKKPRGHDDKVTLQSLATSNYRDPANEKKHISYNTMPS